MSAVAPLPGTKTSDIVRCTEGPKKGYRYVVCHGTPSLGLVRMEWHQAISHLVMPTNWGFTACNPLNFHVDDAQNIICRQVLAAGAEWLWLIEDDTMPPPNACLLFHEWIRRGDTPVVSGLYYLKGAFREPVMYRGPGRGAFTKFTPGETVWVDGVPTGCLLIHSSLLRLMWDDSPEYEISANGQKVKLRRVFENPRRVTWDEEGNFDKGVGTSDLYWCSRVIKENVLARAGWKKAARRKWPFAVDTRIACGHIDRTTGVIY